MDCVAYTERMPKIGETILGTDFKMGFGGKGANQAVMAGKLGGKTSMITKVNPFDSFGKEMKLNFEAQGVDTRHVLETQDAPTGAAAIHVDSNGSNQIAVVMGANNLITVEDVESARSTVAAAKLLVCQLEIPLEINMAAMRMAREEGCKTFLNTAPAPKDMPAELFSLSDIICPNEPETEALTGIEVKSTEDAKHAAHVLLEKGCRNVILTLGSRGCMLVDDGEHQDGLLISTKRVEAVDTVGAGDCFVGAFAHFFTEGHPIPEAIRRACLVATISVTRTGTMASYPSLEECKAAGVFD